MEQLILVAIFLLVGLVNVIVRWLRQRTPAPPPEAPEALPPPETRPRPPRTLDLPPGARVVPAPAVGAPAVPAAPPGPRRRRAPAARDAVGRRSELRRAIVALTILAPCRGREGEAEVRTPGPAGF
jgi:hypothetical protein